ncbi:MAG: RNA methyltransferase [Clostridia bacterium]|nr:RNA methyltransferase [Clostridia bacterium]
MGNIIEIKDFNAAELDVYARLTENQLVNREHPEEGLFIAESPLVIERALNAGYEPLSFLVEKRELETKAAGLLERCPAVPVYTAELEVLSRLTGFKLTRGMLCAMRRRPLPDYLALCQGARRVSLLEDVVNPTNLGAIIRSAAALNVDAVLLSPKSTDPLYRRAARVSMGTCFQLPWTFLPEGERADHCIAKLREQGFVSCAMALKEDTLSVNDERLWGAERLLIVLGTEGEGLTDETIAACDYTVKIPMSHGVDSLNVAAASAVAFWQLCN